VLWLMNPTRNHEVEGSIPGLAQWVLGEACNSDGVWLGNLRGKVWK